MKKNKFLRAVVFVLLLISGTVPAFAQSIDLHLGCEMNQQGCIELPNIKNQPQRVQAKIALSIPREGLEDVFVGYGEFGDQYLSMGFKEPFREQFSKLTGEIVGKELAIVIDGKILTMPTVKERIPGQLSISNGAGDHTPFWRAIPWLNEMVDKDAKSREQKSNVAVAAYVILGIAVLGGGTYFAFVRRTA